MDDRTHGRIDDRQRLTFEMDEIKLFKSIPKVPATNTVEEFNRLGIGGRIFHAHLVRRQFDLPQHSHLAKNAGALKTARQAPHAAFHAKG